jgi:hypothetical protein
MPATIQDFNWDVFATILQCNPFLMLHTHMLFKVDCCLTIPLLILQLVFHLALEFVPNVMACMLGNQGKIGTSTITSLLKLSN